MSKKNEAKVDEVKVGDRIIMNKDYEFDCTASKGDSGKVLCIDDNNRRRALYTLEITGKGSIRVFRSRFDLASDQPAEKKPMSKFKVGDRIVMNRDYHCLGGDIKKGAAGKIKKINQNFGPFPMCSIKFKGRKDRVGVYEPRLNLAPDQPATTKPPEKKPVKKGIRITAKEVEPNVLEIVDFTALTWDELPVEYKGGLPRVSTINDQLHISVSGTPHEWWYSRGSRITRGQLDYLVKTCKEAGKRLREINTYPKEEFEIVI